MSIFKPGPDAKSDAGTLGQDMKEGKSLVDKFYLMAKLSSKYDNYMAPLNNIESSITSCIREIEKAPTVVSVMTSFKRTVAKPTAPTDDVAAEQNDTPTLGS